MTATIEPTHLVNQQNGIWLDKQARFRFGKYKGFRVRDVCLARPPQRTSRVVILAGGCALIRPRAWVAR
jgi:hypothetical protein